MSARAVKKARRLTVPLRVVESGTIEPTSDCPTDNQLAEYAAYPSRFEAIAHHIDGCAVCRVIVARLAELEFRSVAVPPGESLRGVAKGSPPGEVLQTSDLDDATGALGRARIATAALRSRPLHPAVAAPQVDSTLKHYEIIRKLGQGGMGVVYLARDTKLGRLVAVKVLLESDGRSAERFLAEARSTARCKHENIVVIHEVDEVDRVPYMVLEHLEGRTLRAFLVERAGPLPLSLAVELMLPVVRALGCAHALGIVHRDLKPENVFLTEAGPIKVLDFGIAKQLDADEIERLAAQGANSRWLPALTQEGALVGTVPYMAPEQWRAEKVDPRTDLWAVGIMLFELCTGTHPLAPFAVGQLGQVRRLDVPMPRASDTRPDLGALGDVIDRCLKKRPDERFGGTEELIAALEPLLPGAKAPALREDASPFAGLGAFQEVDAGRFFGRDHDVAALVGRLRSQPLVMVAGPSGAGKSSFVRAGVIPALKRSGEPWEAFTRRPGRRPLHALADLLAQIAATPVTTGAPPDASSSHAFSSASDPDALIAALRAQPGLLGARLRARCRSQRAEHKILVFVDQLEELYTQGIDPAERAAFVACLEGVADDALSPLRVVLCMRSDFLDRLAEDRRLMTEVTRGLWFLPPLDPNGLVAALMRPVEALGYRFETAEMTRAMLRALESAASPLPLLQFTATKLWEARDRGRRLLTQESYEKLGGVAGALSTHADAVLAGLSGIEQSLCRAIFLRLVSPERTRAVVSLPDLRELDEQLDAVDRVVFRLCEARLLLIETAEERAFPTVELVHESLIESWPKLGRWLDDNQEAAEFLARVRPAAKQWEASGCADGLLWRGEAAEEARRWQKRQGPAAGAQQGAREARYLAAVVALGERERRRRRQVVAVLFGALSLVVLLVSALAVQSKRAAERAEAERAEAERSAASARNATRMAAARECQGDPTTMLALLREIEPGPAPPGWGELARWARGAGVATMVLLHEDLAWSAAFSPDGQRIVSASWDKTVRVWNSDGSGLPLVLRGHEDHVFAAAFSPDGQHIVSASADKTVRVWNADGSGLPLVLRGHDAVVYAAAFSPDGQRIASASWDKTVRVWNSDGSGLPLVLRGHDDRVYAAAFSPDGQRIVSASMDKTVRVWNADGSGQPLVLRGHDDFVFTAAWSPDGRRIVSGSEDRTMRVWNADGSGQPLVLRGHDGSVYGAAFSPDGQRIVSASFDKTARVWNADGSGQPLVFRGHADRVPTAAWSPDGQRIVSASEDRTVRVWNADGSVRPLVLRGHSDCVNAAAFSLDGQRIVSAASDRTVRVWKADGLGQPLVLRGCDHIVYGAAFSPDGRRIASASWDGTVRVWKADGSGQPLVLRGHDGGVNPAAWSPDGQRIVSASGDRTVRVWNADGSGQPLVLRGHDAVVYGAAWSPDGGRVVSASKDKTVRVWNADGSGQPLVLRGHDGVVYRAAWSPDGQRIVSASEDRTVRVWKADGSGQPLVLRGHDGSVYGAAFSPDGQRIVSASQDKTVRVWKADGTGQPLVLLGHDDAVNTAVWSPDGRRIVTASDDKTVIVWSDLEPLSGADDPKLWTATNYCMPLDIRQRLLGFPEDQSRADHERCQRRVREVQTQAASPGR
ncbi:nSTAND1 domain-containing NTPase [Sorangium sp. So ce1182]|uniref:nSTAND1 domain-containing NTPase n=1 Tax=Sorangium sp. So ce1182 TaxID=3133334 RepID=UPI003F629A2D